jgi:hypothetical protein
VQVFDFVVGHLLHSIPTITFFKFSIFDYESNNSFGDGIEKDIERQTRTTGGAQDGLKNLL